MNNVENISFQISVDNVMSLIYSLSDVKTRKSITCVSKFWHQISMITKEKMALVELVSKNNPKVKLAIVLDMQDCFSFKKLEEIKRAYAQHLPSAIVKGDAMQVDDRSSSLTTASQIALPSSSAALPQNPNVKTISEYIFEKKYKEASEVLLQLLIFKETNLAEIIIEIINMVGEDNTIHFLNPENLGLLKKDSSRTPMFEIIKCGGGAVQFFSPFLNSQNPRIKDGAQALLDKIVVRFQTFKTQAKLREFGFSLLTLLKVLEKNEQYRQVEEFLKGKKVVLNAPNLSNHANAYMNNAVQMNNFAFVNPAMQPFTIIDANGGIRQLQPLALVNVPVVNLASQQNQEALDTAISLLPVDPLSAFNYLFENGSKGFQVDYVTQVYQTLKTAAEQISDISQQAAALNQLSEWVSQDQFRSFNSIWIAEVNSLVESINAVLNSDKMDVKE